MRVTQQAMLPAPIVTGPNSTARVGEAMVSCEDGGVLIGVSNLRSAWRSGRGFLGSAMAGFNIGKSVSCDTNEGIVAGCELGVAQWNGTSWGQLSGENTVSLGGAPGDELAVGTVNGRLVLIASGISANPVGLGSALPITAVARVPGQRHYVMGQLAASTLASWSPLGFYSGSSTTGSPRGFALGEVFPNDSGVELIIGGTGFVELRSTDLALLETLEPVMASPGFGAAVAVGPSGYPGLDETWVGDPTMSVVHGFLGLDEVDVIQGDPNTEFGASVAVADGQLYVGAPAGAGAVYAFPLPTRDAGGSVQDCNGSMRCGVSPVCFNLSCVGGAVCVKTPKCGPGSMCAGNLCVLVTDGGPDPTSDAGVDAGLGVDGGVARDAGEPGDGGRLDAGVRDAGLEDAGVSDAGASSDAGVSEVERVAFLSGCSTGLSGPLLVGVLVSLRRRRRAAH